MAYDIIEQGQYAILHSKNGDRTLILDGEAYTLASGYFTIAEGSQGELVAREAGNHSDDEIVRKGTYILIEFEQDPEFQDIPYLFLSKGNKYEEIYLPQGLPLEDGERRHYIYTDHIIAAENLKVYLHSPDSGTTDQDRWLSSPRDEPPMDDYFDLTAGDLAERIREMQPAELRRLEEYEQRHKNRTTVLNTIRNQLH